MINWISGCGLKGTRGCKSVSVPSSVLSFLSWQERRNGIKASERLSNSAPIQRGPQGANEEFGFCPSINRWDAGRKGRKSQNISAVLPRDWGLLCALWRTKTSRFCFYSQEKVQQPAKAEALHLGTVLCWQEQAGDDVKWYPETQKGCMGQWACWPFARRDAEPEFFRGQ